MLVRIAAAGLCHSDLSVINGDRPRPLPMVLGHEAAGVVEETGPGVSDVQPGDHVVFSFVPSCGACVPCQSGRPALCEPGARANTHGELLTGSKPFHRAGGERLNHHLGVSAFAERTVVSAASLIRIPSHIPLEKAALFGCAVLTGVGAVINTARPTPGTAVAVFGLGGVGLSAVMGAHLAGCHPVIAVDPLDAKLELATSLGATHAVKAGDDAPDVIRDITGGGAHCTVEAVGSARVLTAAYNATRRGGQTVSAGLPHPDQRAELPAALLVGEERQVTGSYMGSAVPRRDIPRLLALHEAGRLPVDALHTQTLGLAEINTGFDALAAGAAVRQLVTPGTLPSGGANGEA
ncbi:zinc-binding dehydrogenase [Streptomyces chiangmaiensis]